MENQNEPEPVIIELKNEYGIVFYSEHHAEPDEL